MTSPAPARDDLPAQPPSPPLPGNDPRDAAVKRASTESKPGEGVEPAITRSSPEDGEDVTKEERRARRSKNREDAMRAMIIDKAMELLLRYGNRATTMEQIVQAADVSTASVYKYFPGGKDQLYEMLVQRVLKTEKRYLATAFDPNMSPADQLINLGTAYVEFALQYPGFFRFVEQPTVFGPVSAEQQERIAKRVTELLDDVAELIEDAKTKGPPEKRLDKDLNARDTAEILHAAWNGLVGLSVRDDQLRRDGADLRRLAKQATRLVQYGMTSREPQ